MPYGEIVGILTDVGTEASYRFQKKEKHRHTRNPLARKFPYIYAVCFFESNYSQFLSTRSTKNLCFSFSVKRS
jgi:hypothetical protein